MSADHEGDEQGGTSGVAGRAPVDADAPVLESRPRVRRRPREDQGPQALADLLVPTLANLGLKTRARQAQATLAWPSAVGEPVAAQTRVVSFLLGRLTVETSSPALSDALNRQRTQIIERLNGVIGEMVVRSLAFRLAVSQPGEKPA